MGKKKPFIGKKENATRYYLASRPGQGSAALQEQQAQQRMRGTAGEAALASQLRLQEQQRLESIVDDGDDMWEDVDDDDLFDEQTPTTAAPAGSASAGAPKRSVAQQNSDYNRAQFELGEYGFPDDGYDYSAHLRPLGTGGGTFIPALTLPSARPADKKKLSEEEIKQIIKEDPFVDEQKQRMEQELAELDPEIRAALEAAENSDFEGELEDDFVIQANLGVTYRHPQGKGWEPDAMSQRRRGPLVAGYLSDEDDDDDMVSFATTTARTHTEAVQDAQFDKLIEDYDDDDLGSLDGDEGAVGVAGLEGEILSQILTSNVVKYQKVSAEEFFGAEARAPGRAKVAARPPPPPDPITRQPDPVDEAPESEEDEEDGEDVIVVETRKRQMWDVESVVSTYSNLDNHPTVISVPKAPKQIRVSEKTGIPLGVLGRRRDEPEDSASEDSETESQARENLGQPRRKDETPEEKRQRKQAAKQVKQEQREAKKATKREFEEARLRQQKLQAVPGYRASVRTFS